MKNQTSKLTFIVDDDPFWTALLTQLLTDLGYTNIVPFSNGADCIKEIHQNPCLIFLDYHMDDMNGLEVMKKVKAYNSEMVAILCTDQKEISVAVRAMKNGAFDYLAKSDSIKEGLAVIIKSMEDMQVFAEKVY